MAAPILVRRLPGDHLVALAAVCTHRGCQVEARPSGYDCPCHGSQFDLDGAVVQGPADRPLLRLPIVAHAGGIAIAVPG
ncbi:MAG: hypothetical protein EXR72_21295 [Myxococcales bacterium]|nr:hypothetical protein [Myxococcales bacterium]